MIFAVIISLYLPLGHPADQVCFSAQLRKLLPQRYLISNSSQSPRYSKSQISPSQHDVESIFHLAQSSKHFDELQKKLQVSVLICSYRYHLFINHNKKVTI